MGKYDDLSISKWHNDERNTVFDVSVNYEGKVIHNKKIKNFGTGKVTHVYDSKLNAFDVNDSIIDYLIMNYDDNKLANERILDEKFLTIDMIIKLAINGLGRLIPEEYMDEDIKALRVIGGESLSVNVGNIKEIEANIESFINDIRARKRIKITEEKIEYIEEEIRALNAEKKEIDDELLEQLNNMAKLIKKRNSVYNRMSELK